MIRALLLDFNGVVIDDELLQMNAYKELVKEDEIDLTEEKYFACMGMNDEVFLKTIYEREGKVLDDAKLPEMIEAKTAKWQEQIDSEIPLFDGVEDFIKRMENDFVLGLVSMARRKEIEYVLEKTGLRGAFSAVVTAEDVTTVKPDPACYREGFRLVDLAKTAAGSSPLTRKECVVIEDSPQGIMAGKAIRLKTLGVTNSVDAEKLREAGADVVTKTLKDWFPNSFREVFAS